MENSIAEEAKKRGAMPAAKAEGSSETVTIEKGQLDSLLERLARLENPGVISKPKRVKEHMGRLPVWEDRLVVVVGQVKEKMSLPSDHPDRMTIPLTVQGLDGKQEKIVAPYIDFMRSAVRVPVKFLQMHQEKRIAVDERDGGGGRGTKLSIDKEGRLMDQSSGEEIEFEVEYVDVSAEVEVMDGPFTGTKVQFTKDTINAVNA